MKDWGWGKADKWFVWLRLGVKIGVGWFPYLNDWPMLDVVLLSYRPSDFRRFTIVSVRVLKFMVGVWL